MNFWTAAIVFHARFPPTLWVTIRVLTWFIQQLEYFRKQIQLNLFSFVFENFGYYLLVRIWFLSSCISRRSCEDEKQRKGKVSNAGTWLTTERTRAGGAKVIEWIFCLCPARTIRLMDMISDTGPWRKGAAPSFFRWKTRLAFQIKTISRKEENWFRPSSADAACVRVGRKSRSTLSCQVICKRPG